MLAHRVLVVGLLGIALGGCPSSPPTTGLFEKGTHTGTATLLRADTSQIRNIGDEAVSPDQERRFVRLRHKGDLVGLDGSEQIVTETSKVVISLNSVFIKYFKELGGSERQGEIAMVISFDGGTAAKESLLIYSAQGQTLGSFLDFDDWPIIGPVEIDSDSLILRVVIIELDQVENEQTKQFIRGVARLGSTIAPQASFAFAIAQPIAELIVNLNADDVVFDHRFSLKRVSTGDQPTRNALLFGRYALVLQEDVLRGDDAKLTVPLANLPVMVSDMRFDLHSNRLYKVYNYYPSLYRPNTNPEIVNVEPLETCRNSKNSNYPFTYAGTYYEGKGPIDWNRYFPHTDEVTDPLLFGSDSRFDQYRRCLLKVWVNDASAQQVRSTKLGYKNSGSLGEFELYPDLGHAIEAALIEGIRHLPRAQDDLTNEEILDFVQRLGGGFAFNYPAVLYPEAFTLLAQYPLHTHMVFTVEESRGSASRKYHERFQKFEEFLQAELKTAGDNDRAGKLAEILNQAVTERRNRDATFKKIGSLGDNPAAKACALFPHLLDENDPVVLANGEIYNKIFNVTGQWMNSREEVKSYIESEGQFTVDLEKKQCTPPAPS